MHTQAIRHPRTGGSGLFRLVRGRLRVLGPIQHDRKDHDGIHWMRQLLTLPR